LTQKFHQNEEKYVYFATIFPSSEKHHQISKKEKENLSHIWTLNLV
jgi:hypothetical protein